MADWINTFTGRKFYPLDPRVEDIDILDIAHALSMQCRFTGHCRTFYSVAQHSVHVAQRCPEKDQLWGLLHDAAEAYLVDLARPVKHDDALAGYRLAEGRLMERICERFGLPVAVPESVHRADNEMLSIEAGELMNLHPDWRFQRLTDFNVKSSLQYPLSPPRAERTFLDLFEALHVPKAA